MIYKRLFLCALLSFTYQARLAAFAYFDRQLLSFMTALVLNSFSIEHDQERALFTFADYQTQDCQYRLSFDDAQDTLERARELIEQPFRGLSLLEHTHALVIISNFALFIGNEDLYSTIDDVRTEQTFLMQGRDYLIYNDMKVPRAVADTLDVLIRLEQFCERSARQNDQTPDQALKQLNKQIIAQRKRVIDAIQSCDASGIEQSNVLTYRSRMRSGAAAPHASAEQTADRKDRQRARRERRLQRMQECRNEYSAP